MLNIKKIAYGSLAVFAGLYLVQALVAPLDVETLAKYNLSELQLRLLSASIVAPVLGIWACATYGFVHFKQYALSIKGSGYGRGINTIANGLGIIALQLLVSGSFSAITSFESVANALGGNEGVEILSTNLSLGFALAAALVLFQGASQLNASLARPAKPKAVTKSFYALVVTGLVYLVAIVLSYVSEGAAESIYTYVPLGVAIFCVGVPYIIIWHFYLLAARNLHFYRQHVKGRVYKQALGLLTKGVYVILGSSVLVQLLGTFGNAFSDLQLLPLLVIVYVLIGGIAVGFLYVARAASKLKNAEN